MFYLTYAPAPPLSEFVDYFWLFEGGQAARKERIVPSGTMELVVNLRDDEIRLYDREQKERQRRYSGAVLSGTYSRILVIDAMQHESMLGVHFKPGGAFPFLTVKASDLTDAHADLTDLWGRSARELRERLCSCNTFQERFHVMEEMLTARLRRSQRVHPAVPRSLNYLTVAGASVRDVAREVGICQRRLTKVFADQVGLSPKLFSRIYRFQRARFLADKTEEVVWAQLASNCGYFDQSHLINDFQEFAGLTPVEYRRRHQPDARLKSHHIALP